MIARSSRLPGRATASEQRAKSHLFDELSRKLARNLSRSPRTPIDQSTDRSNRSKAAMKTLMNFVQKSTAFGKAFASIVLANVECTDPLGSGV